MRKRNIIFLLVVMLVMGVIVFGLNSTEQLKTEPVPVNTGNVPQRSGDTERPSISEKVIKLATDELTKEGGDDRIGEAVIIVDQNMIKIIIMASHAISEDNAKQLGLGAVKQVGTVIDSQISLDTPGGDLYGSIYDHYDVYVGVYPMRELDPDKYYAYGVKLAGAKEITW